LNDAVIFLNFVNVHFLSPPFLLADQVRTKLLCRY